MRGISPDHCLRLAPGDTDHSVVLVRMRSRDGLNQMPPLGSKLLEPSVGQRPAISLTAGRAHEPGRPSQPLQVVQAVGVGPEPGLKLTHGSRVVLAGARVVHRGILHH